MHRLFIFFLKLVTKQLMRLVMLLTKEKTNYTVAPPDILSPRKVELIFILGHLLPSIVISIVVSVKILPAFWPCHAIALANNSLQIPISIFLILLIVLIVVGIVIEAILNGTSPRYYSFKAQLRPSNYSEA